MQDDVEERAKKLTKKAKGLNGAELIEAVNSDSYLDIVKSYLFNGNTVGLIFFFTICGIIYSSNGDIKEYSIYNTIMSNISDHIERLVEQRMSNVSEMTYKYIDRYYDDPNEPEVIVETEIYCPFSKYTASPLAFSAPTRELGHDEKILNRMLIEFLKSPQMKHYIDASKSIDPEYWTDEVEELFDNCNSNSNDYYIAIIISLLVKTFPAGNLFIDKNYQLPFASKDQTAKKALSLAKYNSLRDDDPEKQSRFYNYYREKEENNNYETSRLIGVYTAFIDMYIRSHREHEEILEEERDRARCFLRGIYATNAVCNIYYLSAGFGFVTLVEFFSKVDASWENMKNIFFKVLGKSNYNNSRNSIDASSNTKKVSMKKKTNMKYKSLEELHPVKVYKIKIK